MTENIPQTSASERVEAARKTLAQGNYAANAFDLAEALRSLITPPGVDESEDRIAQRIMDDPYVGNGMPIEQSLVREMVEEAVRAGIQAAHETWEPADVPSQEFMLRHLGIIYQDVGGLIIIAEQFLTKEGI